MAMVFEPASETGGPPGMEPVSVAAAWAQKRAAAMEKAARLRAQRLENPFGSDFLDRVGAAERRDEDRARGQGFGEEAPVPQTPPPPKAKLPKTKKKLKKIAVTPASPSSPLKKKRAAEAAAKLAKEQAAQEQRSKNKPSACDPGRELVQHGYEPLGPIAAGAFSTILRARCVATGEEVAVKTFDAAKCGKAVMLAQARDNELAVLRLLMQHAAASAPTAAVATVAAAAEGGASNDSSSDGGGISDHHGGGNGAAWGSSSSSSSSERPLAGRHPHIANMLAEHDGPLATHAVLEYCTGGSLQRHLQLLQKTRAPTRGVGGMSAAGAAETIGMPEAIAACVLAQVASAVRHLHSLDVAHRDIKPANILFDGALGAAEAQPTVKLCDFGFALRCGGRMLKKQVGTPQYVAPELTIPPDAHAGYRGKPVDLWALGCVLYEMLHGKPAFYGSTAEQLETRIRAVSHEACSKDLTGLARALIGELLVHAPAKRLTAKALCAAPWLTQARKAGAGGTPRVPATPASGRPASSGRTRGRTPLLRTPSHSRPP